MPATPDAAPSAPRRLHGSVQKEGGRGRRTKALADAFSPYRHRASAPPIHPQGDPATATGQGGEPWTPGPRSLGSGGPGQPARGPRRRRWAIRAARDRVLLGPLPGRPATRDRAAAVALEREPARPAALAERSGDDLERRPRAGDGAAGRASIRSHRTSRSLIATRRNRVQLWAGARSSPRFRETAPRAPAFTTAQHPAGR